MTPPYLPATAQREKGGGWTGGGLALRGRRGRRGGNGDWASSAVRGEWGSGLEGKPRAEAQRRGGVVTGGWASPVENGQTVAARKAGFTAEGTEGAEEGDKQGRGVAGGEPECGGAWKGGSPRRREGSKERIGIGRGPRLVALCSVEPPAWTQAALRQHTLAMAPSAPPPPPAAGSLSATSRGAGTSSSHEGATIAKVCHLDSAIVRHSAADSGPYAASASRISCST